LTKNKDKLAPVTRCVRKGCAAHHASMLALALPPRATGAASTSSARGGAGALPPLRPHLRPSLAQRPPRSASGPPAAACAASGPRAAAWRPVGRRGSSGRRTAEEEAAPLQPAPPAAGGPSSPDPQQPDDKKKKKRKGAGGGGYSGPSPRQLVRRAGIRVRALAGRAAKAVATWPGVRHVLGALTAVYASTLPARFAAAATADALAVDYGAFLATETRRTWSWAASHPVERSVAREHVRWVRTFILTAAWATAAPATIAWTLGVPAVLLSAPWGLRGQVKSPVLWAVLFVCQGLGKWPVGGPLMPVF